MRLSKIGRPLFAAAFFLAVSAGAAPRYVNGNQGLVQTPARLAELETAAKRGSGQAAYTIYLHFEGLNDQSAAAKWLRRSASLGWGQGERALALLIKNNGWLPGEFGKTRPSAVYRLLEKAAKQRATYACADLANCYDSDYGGRKNLTLARQWYLAGAKAGSGTCRRKIAEYLCDGLGGPRNSEQAYYWISVEFFCVHPGSVSGQEILALRDKIEATLTLPQLENLWPVIDRDVAQIWSGAMPVEDRPFLEGMVGAAIPREGRRLVKKIEDKRRDKLRHP